VIVTEHLPIIEILTAVLSKIQVFWGITPCRLVKSYRRFGGKFPEKSLTIYRSVQCTIPEEFNIQSTLLFHISLNRKRLINVYLISFHLFHSKNT